MFVTLLDVSPQRLGQHFLVDDSWRERIAREALGGSPGPEQNISLNPAGSLWIEIGAGHGEMTALLSREARRVIAIELDAALIPGLRELAIRLSNVTVVPGDVLTLDLAALADSAELPQLDGLPREERTSHASRHFRVYGNLPYYITSPIVHRLFDDADRLDCAFIVVQSEVADRIAARPGRRDYGYFSAFTQFYARPEILLRIPPGAFRPPPKVASALVRLQPPGERAALGIADERGFLDFLKICFAQKRKTLRNNLRVRIAPSHVPGVLRDAGIAPDTRAEQLSLPDFARLFAACGQCETL